MSRKSFLLACAAAIVLIVAADANAIENVFHFDDSHVVEQKWLRTSHAPEPGRAANVSR